MIPRTLVIFDHVRSEMEIATLPGTGDPAAAYDAAARTIDSILSALGAPLDPKTGGNGVAALPHTPQSNLSREQFEERVLVAKEHVLAGDAFQIALSQRLTARTSATPFQIYRALRITNPSPYMFFFDAGDFQLVGSSPEVLVKLHRRKATLSPIAGTRPRGRSAAEDQVMEDELLDSEKERAEHVMLVDLGRNDLGRVSEYGSVKVRDLMYVERYSHVMHLVSALEGRLRPELGVMDAFAACFPAGTLSGAPKVRAMQIIEELEPTRRGVYGGAVLYADFAGNLDSCIAIRTMVMKGKQAYLQAGAGIVADSDPQREFEESENKARAVLRAVEMARSSE
jgi:anthranilate synthase component 1